MVRDEWIQVLYPVLDLVFLSFLHCTRASQLVALDCLCPDMYQTSWILSCFGHSVSLTTWPWGYASESDQIVLPQVSTRIMMFIGIMIVYLNCMPWRKCVRHDAMPALLILGYSGT